MDHRNVTHPLLDHFGEIDIGDATAGTAHRCQPEIAGQCGLGGG
jgi:hypothetical protein